MTRRRNLLVLMSHINLSITTITLLVFTCHSQTQLLSNKCWFDAPTVQEENINIQIVTRNSTTSFEGSMAWNVSVTIEWSRPTDFGKGGAYVVKLNQIPSFSQPSFCEIGADESIVKIGEEYTFYNLEFGFLYEFTVYVYNVTNSKKALMGTTAGFATPDCFQATGDRRFCSGEEVEFAGAPIEPILNHLCQNDSWVRATISWYPPIQLNGNVTSYGVQHAELSPRGLIMSETAYVTPETNRGPDGRIYYTISDLQPGLAYLIEITPYVSTSTDGKNNEGLAVEMTFIAALWQGPETSPAPANLFASPGPGNTLPLCPPEMITDAITTKPTTTTQPPQPTTTEEKQPSTPSVSKSLIDENQAVDGHEEVAVKSSQTSAPKPITVTVKVLIKEDSSNKAIAVVISLLLCAILLGIVWLGVKVLKGKGSSAKKSTSVVVTDTGNKTAEKTEACEKV